MEEILKFVSAKQSVRTKSYLFFWKIFVALCLTKHFSKDILNSIDVNSLTVSKVLAFTFSGAFIVLLFTYITFIVVFFLSVRFISHIIGFFTDHFFTFSFNLFEVWFGASIKEFDSKSYFKDRLSMQQVRFLLEMSSEWNNTMVRSIKETISLILANCCLLEFYSDQILIHWNHPILICIIYCLNILFGIFLFINLIFMIFLNSKNEQGWEHFMSIISNGYLEDNHLG